jgi:hypothetical protein
VIGGSKTARLATTALASALAWAGLTAYAATPLLALRDADMAKTRETGCNFLFDVGRQTHVFAIGSELMIRTANGLAMCRPGDRPIAEFIDGKRALTCGGLTLRLTRMGRVSNHEESDSADWPARLTVTRGTVNETLRGSAGTAC